MNENDAKQMQRHAADETERHLLGRWDIISETGDDDEIRAFIEEMNQLDADRERRLAAPEALAQAALWYAQQNIPVFPLQPRSKEPFPHSHGFKDATTDPDQVRQWWQTNPSANIGAPTGVVFDVIDIDGPEGFASLATMRENEIQLPEIYGVVFTPRGGRHFLIKPSGRGIGSEWAPGIDYRGHGGYVAMAPSVGVNGARYDWIHTPRLAELTR